eukprot:CAMPEP_0197888426 /NCGR_PEP_ID=MMETSP1439-20131203/21979_1 /TAXON_ID=66791 /ORGANISM="Gonyaulax spinifera, Strain CCMP409" /LENGTH=558 /DNA_ID=CAMNT_0043508337 /DNA_START=1 /DNA_END=1677 /DNA_ORIENTATION=+
MRRIVPWFALLCHGALGGEMTQYLKQLPFDATVEPEHTMEVGVGIWFDNLFLVTKDNIFTAEFYLTYRWRDNRNYSSLFQYNLHQVETSSCSTVNRKFVELGHDELAQIWAPDLVIANQHKSDYLLRSEQVRISSDGTVELIRMVWVRLELLDPNYAAFPFDTQSLPIIVNSQSYHSSRVKLSVIPSMSGVEQAMIGEWPGWIYKKYEIKAHDESPDFALKKPCRTEKRSQVHLNVFVDRSVHEIIPGLIVPTMLLVITSWGAFFITIQALMPRVATAFISFLTLTTWSTQISAKLPVVNYAIWFSVFIDTSRFFVFLSLLETVVAQFLIDNVGTRMAKALDQFSRVLIPPNFFLLMIVTFCLRTPKQVEIAHYLTLIDIFIVVSSSTVFVFLKYRHLMKLLRTDPLRAYGDGAVPFSAHLVSQLFKMIDHTGDGTIQLEELVRHVRISYGEDRKSQLHADELNIIKHMRTKMAEPITIETFRKHQSAFFVDVRRLCLLRKMNDDEKVEALRTIEASEGNDQENREEEEEDQTGVEASKSLSSREAKPATSHEDTKTP